MSEHGSIAQDNKLVTGEELENRADVGPCELVEGRVVLMVPTGDDHGGCELKLGLHLESFVEPRKLGKVRVGEVGIYTRRNPDTVRAADVLFISSERYAQRKSRKGFLDVAPDLVVEILSPGDRFAEVMTKIREYLACGVRLVWIADPAARTVTAYRSLTDVRVFGEDDDLPGDDVLPGFSPRVSKLFE
jgi:Uma2 family endonuclease